MKHFPRPSSSWRCAAVAITALLGAACSSAAVQPSAGAAADTCVSGTLSYTFKDAESPKNSDGTLKSVTEVVPRAKFEVWDATTLLTSGHTDTSGRFSACTGKTSVSGLEVWFGSSAADGKWQVVDEYKQYPTKDDLHWFHTPTVATQTGAKDYGVVQPPAAQQGAFRILRVVNKLYEKRDTSSACFAAVDTDGCDTLTYAWNASQTGTGFWDHSDDTRGSYWSKGELYNTNFVVLDGVDARSQHTIVHEAGHWLQWQLHDRRFPKVTNCQPHYVDEASSESCAWTEGFADAVAGWVLNDRRYVNDAGTSTYFEPSGCTPTVGDDCFWQGGRATQGNVGAAMLDFWDADGGWNAGFASMGDYVSPTVKAYYEDRYDQPSSEVQGVYTKHGLHTSSGVL